MPTIVHIGNDIIEKQVVPCGVSQAAPAFPIADGSIYMPFQVDPNGSLFVNQQGTIPADAITPGAQPVDSTSYMMVWNGLSWDRVSEGVDADAYLPSSVGTVSTMAKLLVFDGTSWNRPRSGYDSIDNNPALGVVFTAQTRPTIWDGNFYQRERTPAIFKTIVATAAGSTAVWTPAAGKKFRVMRVHMSITSNAAAAVAAVLLSRLLDGATFFGISDNNYIPLAGVIQQHQNFTFDLGNGYLSSAANNVLNIDLSFALTAGILNVTVAGTEE